MAKVFCALVGAAFDHQDGDIGIKGAIIGDGEGAIRVFTPSSPPRHSVGPSNGSEGLGRRNGRKPDRR